MAGHHHQDGVPRIPLIGAGALVLLSLAAVVTVRVLDVATVRVADAPPVSAAEFRFEDRPDGSIAVFDARDGTPVHTVAPGTNGFLRGTLRGLARERKRRDIGPEAPYVLVGRADGRLTLQDPATGRHVDLEAFGPTNAGVFAELLASREYRP